MDTNGKTGRSGKGSRTRPIVLCEPELVPITDDDEQRALEALIGLLGPLFVDTQPDAEANE